MSAPELVAAMSYRASLRNVGLLLHAMRDEPGYSLRYNEFFDRVERAGQPLRESDLVDIAILLEEQFQWDKRLPSVEMVRNAVTWASRLSSYHPVKSYVKRCHDQLVTAAQKERARKACREWLVRYCGVRDCGELRVEQSKCMLVGALERIHSPGCQWDTVPVFVSAQGWYKSSLIRAMVPDKTWHTSTAPDLRSKDAYQANLGLWVGEIPELKSVLANSPETVKAWVTSRSDRYRPPYSRMFVDQPRSCVWWATANPPFSLRDSSGNRRYWILEMAKKADIKAIARDRELIWGGAELYRREGYQYWLSSEALEEEVGRQREAYEGDYEDPWVVAAQEWKARLLLRTQSSSGWGHVGVADFLREMFDLQPPEKLGHDQKDVLRATKALKLAGFESYRQQVNGVRRRFWRSKQPIMKD